jgi:hypothetical protein
MGEYPRLASFEIDTEKFCAMIDEFKNPKESKMSIYRSDYDEVDGIVDVVVGMLMIMLRITRMDTRMIITMIAWMGILIQPCVTQDSGLTRTMVTMGRTTDGYVFSV